MTCRSCGMEIADKAIVCYRCGAPTALPVRPKSARPARSIRWPWLLVVLVAVLAALADARWVVPVSSPTWRPVAVGLVVAAVLGLVVLMRGRRR